MALDGGRLPVASSLPKVLRQICLSCDCEILVQTGSKRITWEMN